MDTTDLKAIEAKLLGLRYQAGEVPHVDDCGVYAFFITNPAALSGVTVNAAGLLYVGMTESCLDVRNHFTHQHSGFSSLRRTLGALLKQELALQAIPRATGRSLKDIENYRFTEKNEVQLTEWMTKHLAYTFAVAAGKEVVRVEDRLIKTMQPPLNLNRWPNPQGKHLRALRDVCRDEARRLTAERSGGVMTVPSKLKQKGAEPELATGWPVSKVATCMNKGDSTSLVKFLRKRYEERFLNPLRTLMSAPDHRLGYGFSIMALCSLLIESLQSYRDGLPTTYQGEYGKLAHFNPPAAFEVPTQERKNGKQAFQDFFSLPQHKALFPDVDGGIFHDAIRNGLLHQAQTKSGWTIRTGQSRLWDAHKKIVDRNKFTDALTRAFNQYLEELNLAAWDAEIWKRARRKLWWLMKLSA
jgi:hypothetical protein